MPTRQTTTAPAFVVTQAQPAQRSANTQSTTPPSGPRLVALGSDEFDRLARAHVALVGMYADKLAAAGAAGPNVTAEDLRALPMARLQALALALPAPTAKPGA